ncbi:HU family DNA-binding protein [Bosea sp. SSUT16]|uniref:HU family DNA-binding protein n=1 Tax=Bosea spartocytisi TaxID=2773451 RepID=A0A927HWP9_9HYPH|nr:HU family DNA-binding protein [Bosea spartocytisi]MBD3844585.1 HU family DNA-binding protein [Bosea spartocytisi]MCT4470308.1 HU family DNA-binding protein [Bosea spartocytisi]
MNDPDPARDAYNTLLKEDFMTKNELIAAIAEETGKTKADVSAILASLGTTVAKTLKGGDDVTLGGIGKLSAAKREAREARNPSTGATIKVPAKTVVKFKVTKDLADAVA